VCDFKVALTEPMKAESMRLEVREGTREAVVVPMPLSLPPRGASPELRLIAHLDSSLPARGGTIRGRVAAIGPKGYKVKWTGFSGSYNWER